MRHRLRTRLGIIGLRIEPARSLLARRLRQPRRRRRRPHQRLGRRSARRPASRRSPRPATSPTSPPVGPRAAYEEVDCKLQHRTETVYVGTYADPAAEAAAPPGGRLGGRAGGVPDLRSSRPPSYVGGAVAYRPAVDRRDPAVAGRLDRWRALVPLRGAGDQLDRGRRRPGACGSAACKDALADPARRCGSTCYAIELDSDGAIDTDAARPTAGRAQRRVRRRLERGRPRLPDAGQRSGPSSTTAAAS